MVKPRLDVGALSSGGKWHACPFCFVLASSCCLLNKVSRLTPAVCAVQDVVLAGKRREVAEKVATAAYDALMRFI
jgi:transcription elongation factor Elf1